MLWTRQRRRHVALVLKVGRTTKDNPRVHAKVDCNASTFEIDGERYLQLDTLGSADRKDKGQISQVIQFDRRAAEELRALLNEMLDS
jgi:hypothetical protein